MKKNKISLIVVFIVLSLITILFIMYKNHNNKDGSTPNDFHAVSLIQGDVKSGVYLRIVEYNMLSLDKWQWPINKVEKPMWFKAFQAMNDPRKFDSFQEYTKYTTNKWRLLTKTNSSKEFDEWKRFAFENSVSHDQKEVKILRSVELKFANESYVFVAISKGALSPITKTYEIAESIVPVVYLNGNYCCADLASDFLLVINPESKEKIEKILKAKLAKVNHRIIVPNE